jgi:Spy/CpxP family protein refolding chaperone
MNAQGKITQNMGLHWMTSFINLFILFLVLQISAFSQPPMPAPGQGRLSPAERAEQLKDELNLTEAQTAKVKLIFEEQHKEMRKLQQQSEDERMAMRDSMMKNRKEADEKILALLNDKQKEAFKELQKHHRSKRDDRTPPPDQRPHD